MNKGFIIEIRLIKEDEDNYYFLLPKGLSINQDEIEGYITFMEGREDG